MARGKQGGVPELRRHKPSKRAVVRLNGKDHYVGAWPDDASEPPAEAKAAYDSLIARWLANQRRSLQTAEEAKRQTLGQAVETPPTGLTVAALILRYVEHAQVYYARPDGSPGSEYKDVRLSMRPLNHAFSGTPAAEFGPLKLKAVRQLMVDGYEHPKFGEQPALSRRVINQRCKRITRMFRWAAADELVPATVPESLRMVAGLAKGRSPAREAEPVLPVSIDDVEKTIPHLTPHLQGAARLQLLTGMRPTEALTLRLADLNREQPVWIYRPASHKTLWRGKARNVAIGPRAQQVLKEYIKIHCLLCGVEGRPPRIGSRDNALCGPCADRMDEQDVCGPWQRVECQPADAHLFSPREAMRERDEDRRAARKSKVPPSQRNRRKKNPRRKAGESYDVRAYNHTVASACKAAGVPAWSPNQLRHTHATEVRRLFGLEAAQVSLGHSQADVTQLYAERDLALAAKVAEQIG